MFIPRRKSADKPWGEQRRARDMCRKSVIFGSVRGHRRQPNPETRQSSLRSGGVGPAGYAPGSPRKRPEPGSVKGRGVRPQQQPLLAVARRYRSRSHEGRHSAAAAVAGWCPWFYTGRGLPSASDVGFRQLGRFSRCIDESFGHGRFWVSGDGMSQITCWSQDGKLLGSTCSQLLERSSGM